MFKSVAGFVLLLTCTGSVSAGEEDVEWRRETLSVCGLGRPRFEETYHLRSPKALPRIDSTPVWLPQQKPLTKDQLAIIERVIRDDFLVNDDTRGGCRQWYPSVAVQQSGGIVVAWHDERNGASDIYAQRYDSIGAPQGLNSRVNDDVGSTEQGYPSVATDGTGGFVVAWYDYRNGDPDIYAQRYDPSGVPQGSNFRVNDDVGSARQLCPSVAMGDAGGFVVAWEDGRSGSNIYAQMYDSSGNPQGPNFKVNDDPGPAWNWYPSIAMNGSGGFVVAWERDANDIYAQRYDSLGSPQGPNFRVNDDPGSAQQRFASAAMAGTGGFAVAWHDYRNGNYDVYAQRYDSLGNPQGSNFRVNDDMGSTGQLYPSAAMDESGALLVTWHDSRNGDYDIYAQRYDSSGAPQGPNFRVTDDVGSAFQVRASAAMDGTGRFVVVWSDYRPDDARYGDSDVYAQRYDASGAPQGGNFKVNDDTGSAGQYYPSGAMGETGRFVLAWTDERSGDSSDVYAQAYDSSGNPQGPNFKVNDDTGSAWQYFPSVAMDGSGRSVIAWQDYRNGLDGDIYAQRYDSAGVPQGLNFRVNDDIHLAWQSYPAAAMDGSGGFAVAWYDYRNGDWDIYAQRYSSSGGPQGSNFRVNEDGGSAYHRSPSMAMDRSGGFVVAWEDKRNGWLQPDIYAQRYDSSGNPQGSNFKVNDDAGTTWQSVPSAAMDETAAFVITWQDDRNGHDDIYAQRYDPSGIPQGGNFRVNDDGGSAAQSSPSVTIDPAGGRFVVFWTDFRNPDGDPEVVAQKYVDGVASGPNLQINQPDSFPYNHQLSWTFSLASNSDEVAFTWMDNRRHKGWDIYAKLTDWDLIGIEEHSKEYLHTTYSLVSYPNPFVNRTILEFGFTKSCVVNLKIYDTAGREMASLLRKRFEPGNHRIVWAPEEVPSGIYFARLALGDFYLTKKMVVLR